ncbi:hypothetical protein I862_00790 [endosymbiont of Acanthamoeba sp. UWC8]|uniref:hypothetical protein n=1 Tax=endosymbiont of Acanthamoeba sp. UWC8 TaxID=86106 RepID=UPI0004D1264C|nr:hypothetical protein [endosymbiont of Acanthamoeba sp. UWC8]AIF80723.1 hypothetical protein I862_00790 [endosymbiont of Acanthamoeba sp. UWC8]
MAEYKEYSQSIMKSAFNIGAELISRHFKLTPHTEIEEEKLNTKGIKEEELDASSEKGEEEHHSDSRGRKVLGKFTAKFAKEGLGAHEPEQGKNNS